jgi:hypothetical protein
VRNPIDAFVLQKLEAKGLAPAPEADRHTLARRLSLDLTGLPPKPQDVQEFVNDQAPDAYEKYVDKLLASQQWGEHRARYWLDAARYADTHGIHFDNYREIWAYRDWVINAFNRNLPFDQFTIEQLAGDLLPNATLDQKIASGFNRCNITTNEGGIIDEEYLVLYTRDRTETFGQVWLGSTVGCAVCHDHKFDPLSQREFYELAAFFNNTTQGARDGNVPNTPPIVQAPLPQDRARLVQLAELIPQARQQQEARRAAARGEFDNWLASAAPTTLETTIPTAGLYVHVPLSVGDGRVAQLQVDGKAREVPLAQNVTWKAGPSGASAIEVQGQAVEVADVGDFERDGAFSYSAWIKLPASDASGAICARMNRDQGYRGWDFWVQRRQVGTHIISTWPGNALKVVGKNQIPANEWTHVAVTYDGSSTAAGVRIYYNGQLQENVIEANQLSATIKVDVPWKIGQRHNSDPFSGQLHDLRLYRRALSDGEVSSLAQVTRYSELLAKPADQRTAAEKDELYGWWLSSLDKEYQSRGQEAQQLQQEQAAILARGTIAHIMNEREQMPEAFVLNRGEYDQRLDQVSAKTPAFLPPMPETLPHNRLGLAKWVLSPEQPLTARVTVNRFWQQVFGAGLVSPPGDFGVTGQLPSHPELLDWLAVEFREQAWDVKAFFKMLVMSATYRQAATVTPEKLELDLQNVLLSRGPRFRMDAEMVRDYALAASGLLVPKLGGPSVKPYQPEGVWEAVAMIGSNTRDYKQDSGDALYRRSMYTFWKRSAPPASMDIFNAPSRETCVVRRDRTNTPLQALVTLNDPQFIEAARHLAQRALQEGGAQDEDRFDFIAQRLLARSLQPAEVEIVKKSLADLAAYYTSHAENAGRLITVGESKPDAALDAGQLAAWTMLVNELLNLDEVLNK